MVTIGKHTPDLTLEAYHQDTIKKIRLQDYKGKWLVLVFYPADFTFVCPTELEDLAELYPKFKAEDAEVMCVSTDTVYAHKTWHDTSPAISKINYPMLADPTGALCRELGVYIAEEGLALRGSFVFDPKGMLRAYEVHDNSIGRSADELLRKLQAAKFVYEHTGQVCPAKWKPGEKTLEPGINLVGKI